MATHDPEQFERLIPNEYLDARSAADRAWRHDLRALERSGAIRYRAGSVWVHRAFPDVAAAGRAARGRV